MGLGVGLVFFYFFSPCINWLIYILVALNRVCWEGDYNLPVFWAEGLDLLHAAERCTLKFVAFCLGEWENKCCALWVFCNGIVVFYCKELSRCGWGERSGKSCVWGVVFLVRAAALTSNAKEAVSWIISLSDCPKHTNTRKNVWGTGDSITKAAAPVAFHFSIFQSLVLIAQSSHSCCKSVVI